MKTNNEILNETLTMEEKCFTCDRKQGVNEPYTTFEPEGRSYHIAFCSEKCERIYNKFAKINQKALTLKDAEVEKTIRDLYGSPEWDTITLEELKQKLNLK